MPLLNETFNALNKEAQFTFEMLGAGATQIRKAHYASKGRYFQAFTSLSTGLERIGKLCLLLDHYITKHGTFPSFDYMKREICHDLTTIYDTSKSLISGHSISLAFLPSLDDPIHQAIIQVLHNFAVGDRYSNIDLLVGRNRRNDPVALWFDTVDRPIFDSRVGQKRKDTIIRNARAIDSMLKPLATVLHVSETGKEVTDVREASEMTGMFEAVAPLRQLYVLQIIRYWAELLAALQYKAQEKTRALKREDIPFFNEVFAPFYNPDSYLRTRSTWDKLRP
jgi:hypothetical protein